MLRIFTGLFKITQPRVLPLYNISSEVEKPSRRQEGLKLYQQGAIHHYKLLTTLVLEEGVIQLFNYSPIYMQTDEDSILAKSSSKQNNIFCLRFSNIIENENEEVKVTEWSNIALNFEEVAEFIYLKDQPDKLMILEKSNSKGPISLFAQMNDDIIKIKLVQNNQTPQINCKLNESIQSLTKKYALPFVLGWLPPNQFIKFQVQQIYNPSKRTGLFIKRN